MSDPSQLSTRVHTALFCVNALEPEVAATVPRAALLKLPHIGRKGLTEIEDWLASYGLCPAGSRPRTEVVGSDIRSLLDTVRWVAPT